MSATNINVDIYREKEGFMFSASWCSHMYRFAKIKGPTHHIDCFIPYSNKGRAIAAARRILNKLDIRSFTVNYHEPH